MDQRAVILGYRLLATFLIVSSVRQNYVLAQTTASATHSTAAASITAVSECHLHATVQYCMVGTTEYQVLITPTVTTGLPAEYTGCHSHGSETWCESSNGDEVQIVAEGEESGEHTEESGAHDHEEESDESSSSSRNCHFHAGVEHCVGGSEEEPSEASCSRTDRDYNIPLRVGLLFVILVTSGLGVFVPILVTTFTPMKTTNIGFVLAKQFGTGVIFSTAFVHLYTHASLMFTNECLGELDYEATTSSIVMAGIFLSFLVEYAGQRILKWRGSLKREDSGSSEELVKPDETLSVAVLEGGIIFHSLLIGITLVVSGDSFFLTLFVVILFHQVFEGIALGTRIAALGATPSGKNTRNHLASKLLMAAAFTLVTPVGMAIGIGVLKRFNGNDKSTLVAIGTLDALSAGILMWVGLVKMWAHDWLFGELANAKPARVTVGMVGLVAGAALMSLLGKWA